jgi:hypothetical protein
MAILLMSVFLCANTEMYQLFKLPVLLHHYLEHRQNDHSISFLAFLKEHYVNEHAQASQHHHERLPFKSHSCAGGHISLADPELPVFTLCKDMSVAKQPLMLYKEPNHSNSFVSRIWQPPKSC